MELTDAFAANHPNDTAMANKSWREAEYLTETARNRFAIGYILGALTAVAIIGVLG